jgi:hypothetical protein
MKALIGSITFGIVLLLTAGCEGGWQFGGSASQINESGNWMDISGTYVPVNNSSFLVSDYSAFSGTTTASEDLFTTQTGVTFYSGQIDVLNIDKTNISGFIGNVGTFAVSAAGVVSGGATGNINLLTGAFGITIGAPSSGVTYSITFARTGNNSGPGGSGTISTFSIQQSGNAIRIMDNNGSVYTGQIALTETNSVGGSNTVQQSATYQYDATGVSQAGFNVELVGNFLVNGATVGTNGNILVGDYMTGTWLEQGGKTGHIEGVRD